MTPTFFVACVIRFPECYNYEQKVFPRGQCASKFPCVHNFEVMISDSSSAEIQDSR